jgi:capsular exopolysaccharide synthesis family protein
MDSDENITLRALAAVVRRRGWLIVVCAIIAGAPTYFYFHRKPPTYNATAALLFNETSTSAQLITGAQAVSSSDTSPLATDVELLYLGNTPYATARALGRGWSAARVRNAIAVSSVGATNVVDVTATAGSPAQAARIANLYSNNFVATQASSTTSYYKNALDVVTRQLAALGPHGSSSTAGLALEEREQTLADLASLPPDQVQVVQAALPPTSPSGPKTTRNTAVAVIVGVLIGLGLIFLMHRLDQVLRELSDVEAVYGLPVLGIVPRNPVLGPNRSPVRESSTHRMPLILATEFDLMYARLRYYDVDVPLRVILVTSALPASGKTTVSCQLAAAAARAGMKTLLIECDLRRPTVSRVLDINARAGLSDVLIGKATLNESVVSTEVDAWGASELATPAFDTLIAGRTTPPNPTELLASGAMAHLLEVARSEYALIVIDTAPIAAVSDSFPLLAMADGVVVVARLGQERRDVSRFTLKSLRDVGANLLGTVVNGSSARSGANQYQYAYTSAEREISLQDVAGSTTADSS